MNNWKSEKNVSSPWDVDVRENNIGEPIKNEYIVPTNSSLYIHNPKLSNWTCYMFGNRPGGSGIVYTPQEGRVPNRFVRFMMRICFDSVWIKIK